MAFTLVWHIFYRQNWIQRVEKRKKKKNEKKIFLNFFPQILVKMGGGDQKIFLGVTLKTLYKALTHLKTY